MKKRIIALFVAVLLIFTFTACSNDSEAPDDTGVINPEMMKIQRNLLIRVKMEKMLKSVLHGGDLTHVIQ